MHGEQKMKLLEDKFHLVIYTVYFIIKLLSKSFKKYVPYI
jgi:hypothetical protein